MSAAPPTSIRVIDSHTGGEPTRIVIAGVPDLGGGSAATQMAVFNAHHDAFRRALVTEPRGFDAMVGGLLVPTVDPVCSHGIIFFNNVATLGMCVHGTIGLAVTLKYLQQIELGQHQLETPVGNVQFNLLDDQTVEVTNVPSYRYRKDVAIDVKILGEQRVIRGDVAWGGNWFFLIDDHGQDLTYENVMQLTEVTSRIKRALSEQGVTGVDGAEIDHIELFSPTENANADSKNFVLCPGNQYDRSPCGTGTSAKIACLLADKKIAPREVWRQESIVGSVFQASGVFVDGQGTAGEPVCIPSIRGTAYITADSEMILQDDDPFRAGIVQ
ncbi:MAG: hydroxyproline-2-epimerase [Planctomycetaceae bacterium]|jgi:4-hydroxyproline epimerase|nr:hydroxyproline-2-epimerase [Planctomycetaceae bacterium]MBT4723413.1 hydroxyproline-2-epimerase [Planctomycetaceae bacterium]MBT5124005.1 hydroxyproline-2-epimerase [Planctomycetaceae bacterium]MBT5597037.1 hydroxyproline-2-epimerase [Planctomycetaceae bacterium]MBT5885507.1 hydroxyproline-2-epimerase [Planctomycetaceae bacterium]